MGKRVFLFLPLLLVSCSSSQAVFSSESSSGSTYVPTRRDHIVESMLAMASFRWTPSEDIPYYDQNPEKGFFKGREYVGLPYTMEQGRTATLGDPLGIFKTQLAEDGYTYVGPNAWNAYYGSDCSSSVEGAWRLNGLETGAVYTGSMIPGENSRVLAVGDYSYSSREKMTESICLDNGLEKMYAAYRALCPGDAVVRRVKTSSGGFAGHVRLVESVDAENETVTVIEQCGYGIDSQTTTTWRVHKEYGFGGLYQNRYIPITPKGLE
ncbi:MAG: hypothetical protein K6E59_05725 [Bacilli bacterium]|nr:hypothetical protein [Bacilli bacterium]